MQQNTFWPGRQSGADEGSMSVEIVLLTPVLILFMLLVVACGRYVDLMGELQATTRDAARAASIQRSAGEAQLAAVEIVQEGLSDRANCGPVQVNYQPGPPDNRAVLGRVTTELSCTVSYDDLGLLGLPGSATLTTSSHAPLDAFRAQP